MLPVPHRNNGSTSSAKYYCLQATPDSFYDDLPTKRNGKQVTVIGWHHNLTQGKTDVSTLERN